LRAIPAQADVPAGECWSRHVGRLVGVPVLGGGRVYVSTTDRTILALDQASGAVQWKQFPGDVPRGAPVLVGDYLAVQTSSRLLVLAGDTGALAWDLPGGGAPIGEVGGELLLHRVGGLAEWREIATGQLLAEKVPRAAATCGSRLIELKAGMSIAGWERAGR
jgi:outer membrane protein assembly factor BamB